MNNYDVIVVGGGTAGSSCAYTAAKLGLKVLLIEKNTFLGGSITSALVIPAMKTSENAINTEFFDTLYEKLNSIGGAITYCDDNKGWFNPELTKIVLDEMLTSVGVDILFESRIKEIKKNLSSYIVTIENDNDYLFNDKLLPSIETTYLVDATGDAKICEKLKCDFLEKKFDIVIYDGVPVSGLADAIIMADLVDKIVIVSAYKQTKMEQLQNTKKALEKFQDKIAGVVLNKLPEKKNHYYSYYN